MYEGDGMKVYDISWSIKRIMNIPTNIFLENFNRIPFLNFAKKK